MSQKRRTKRRDAGRPRGAAVEAAILGHVLEELAAHGLDGISVERVATAAEVNKTTVYRRYGTREGLVAAALDSVRLDIEAKVTDTGSLRGDLRVVAGLVAELLASTAGRALAQAAFAKASAPALAAAAQKRLEEQTSAPIVALVERAISRGQWRPSADPQAAFAMLVGAMLHRTFLEGEVVDAAYIDQILAILSAGLQPS